MKAPERNSKPANGKTVLVLDGDVLVQMPVVQFLRDCGYHVVEAANTDEAMAILQKPDAPVDVVLSEIDIPGFMNGFMFAVWARSVRPELKLLLAGTPERMVRNSEQIGGLGRCVVGDPALSLEGPFPACSGNSAFIESGGYAGGTGHSLFLNFSDDREHIGRELIGCRLGRGRAARLRLR